MAEISSRNLGRDRAQLFLVTAIGLAVTFVALALILNTAIFTENLATRGSDTAGAAAAGQYRTAAVDGVTELLTHVNTHNNSSHTALHSNLSTGITYWSNSSGRLYAVDGRSVNISGKTINGTRIIQNESRNFTNAANNDNWVLADDVDNSRGFWINASRAELNTSDQSTLSSESVFNVRFNDDTGGTWRVYIYRNGDDTSEVNVTVEEPSLGITGSCSFAGEHVIVNLTAATIGGDGCSPLGFIASLPAPYEIRYEDATFSAGAGGDTGTGTYELIVDDTAVPGSNFHDDDVGESPFTTPAIYAVTLDIRYEAADLYYNSSARIAPGEPA